jgi:hypothetical protein
MGKADVTRLLEHEEDDHLTMAGSAVAFGVAGLRSAGIRLHASPEALFADNIYFVQTPGTGVSFNDIPSWLNDVGERVAELSTLPPGWDGHRGRPIDHAALRSATGFLTRMAPWVRVPPSIVPTSRGGVVLEWHRGGVDLEILFPEKGEPEISFEAADGTEFEGLLVHWIGLLPGIVYSVV